MIEQLVQFDRFAPIKQYIVDQAANPMMFTDISIVYSK